MSWLAALLPLLVTAQEAAEDHLWHPSQCIPGEQWMENCSKTCLCTNKGGKQCHTHHPECAESQCHYLSVWYTSTQHCQCVSRSGGVVCVNSIYQTAMEGQTCKYPGSYYVDACTYCYCNKSYMTQCEKNECNDISGTCNPGEINIRNCYKCICTNTMFQVCYPVIDCQSKKPGKCPPKALNTSRLTLQELWCVLSRKQVCYEDGDCMNSKKCCLMGCHFVCVAPTHLD